MHAEGAKSTLPHAGLSQAAYRRSNAHRLYSESRVSTQFSAGLATPKRASSSTAPASILHH